MISLPATIAWFAFLITILWMFQRLTRCLTQLNIFTLFVAFMAMRHGLTVPFDHTVNQWFANIDVAPQAYQRFYVSLVLTWVSLVIGVALGRLALGSGVLDPVTFRAQMRRDVLPSGMNQPVFLAVVLGAVGLVALMQLNLRINPLDLLAGRLTSEEYREMRTAFGDATHYSSGLGQRLASIVRFGLLPTFVSILYFMSSRGRLWKVLFAVVLSLTMFIGLVSGQKAAGVFPLIGVAVSFYLRKGWLRLRPTDLRLWALVAIAVLVVFPFLYLLQYPDMTYQWALDTTRFRLTSEYNRGLQLYFQIYPDVEAFLYGKSSGLINALRGIAIPVERLPERFIPIYYVGPGYPNTWNAAFIGTAWADFGYAGVVVQSVVVGLLLQGYARWFRRARKTALVLGTQVGLMLAATRLSEVALTANLLTFGLLSSFLLFWLMKSYRRPRKADEAPLFMAEDQPVHP